MVSYRENFNKLTQHNPSFSRIFHIVEIDHLDDADIETFFVENFSKYNITFENEKSLMEMVYYSWGMPLAMQQIGEETFWNVKSNTITEEMALNGILNAAIEIGKKQISLILDLIENDEYDNILLKLGKNKLIEFEKSELTSLLSDDENRIVDIVSPITLCQVGRMYSAIVLICIRFKELPHLGIIVRCKCNEATHHPMIRHYDTLGCIKQ